MKKEYQSLVSPVVLSGGRPRVIQKPAMKAEYTRIPAAMRASAGFRLENIAAAEPPVHRITATEAKYMKTLHVIPNTHKYMKILSLLFLEFKKTNRDECSVRVLHLAKNHLELWRTE